MASTYLTRSITSTNSSWTFSAWCKRSGLTSTQHLVSWGGSGTGQGIGFSSSDRLQYYSESVSSNPTSSAQFRDISGWYHVVVRNNAGTITLYVNGVALSNTAAISTDRTAILFLSSGRSLCLFRTPPTTPCTKCSSIVVSPYPLLIIVVGRKEIIPHHQTH